MDTITAVELKSLADRIAALRQSKTIPDIDFRLGSLDTELQGIVYYMTRKGLAALDWNPQPQGDA